MSIAVLNQVYDEARRLAVAGSVVATGDFRLKKLIPPLEQAGAKAPVFAKVAESAKKVIDGSEETSAENLLELTSLVTAVLYTQGETGIAGESRPIETINLGGEMAQTSARLLKPLLEALKSTGSGRLELVRDAHERGAFRDLRLVKAALDGLDDPYSEIADFLAEKVIPIYGSVVKAELRRAYDPKGTKGHPRRLKLMHGIDPAGTRELVKQALENGSKEIKVAAISCLGAEQEDMAFLIEQAGAKAQEVRGAAYHALAATDTPAAVDVLQKAISGKDLELATAAIGRSKSDRLTSMLIAEIGKDSAALPKAKDRKQASQTAQRLVAMIRVLPEAEHPAADTLTLDLFARRAELAKVKGDTFSGSDVAEAVIARMANGPMALRKALARAHRDLEPDDLAAAFEAARGALPPAEVYELFSPYVAAGDGKKGKNPAASVLNAIGADHVYWHAAVYDGGDPRPPLDPRWLDLAVKIKHLGLVCAVGRPGHRAAEAFVQAEFDAAFPKAKNQESLTEILTVMVRLQHPKAAEALVASYEKTIGKANANTYWYHHLIAQLPKSAIPILEAVTPKLKDREADRWVEAIQELREKKD
jgi:HEAT repeats